MIAFSHTFSRSVAFTLIRLREVQHLNAPTQKNDHCKRGAHGVESCDRTEALEVLEPVVSEAPSHKTCFVPRQCPVSRVLSFEHLPV